MLITKECDYAVRVVRALDGETRLSVNEICEREDVTVPFAYKILKKLQKADIVTGFRGVHGGYALCRELSELTLLDIYLAIDPELFIIDCLNPDKSCSRHCEGTICTVYGRLEAIQREMFRLFSEKNMEEILHGEI